MRSEYQLGIDLSFLHWERKLHELFGIGKCYHFNLVMNRNNWAWWESTKFCPVRHLPSAFKRSKMQWESESGVLLRKNETNQRTNNYGVFSHNERVLVDIMITLLISQSLVNSHRERHHALMDTDQWLKKDWKRVSDGCSKADVLFFSPTWLSDSALY